jgi:arginyl-tRNA synthetase
VVNHTLRALEPTTILIYLSRLTHQLSSSYGVLRVVNAPEGKETIARAAVYEAARQTIHALLGPSPVEW